MDEQQQEKSLADQNAQPEGYDWRFARRQRRAERRLARASGRGGSWVAGAILIAIGLLLMLQYLTRSYLQNWWALFILIPAVGAFASAWRGYQASGRLSAAVRASVIGGILLILVAAMFLLELDWTILGPVLLVLAGLALLVNALLPR